MSGYSKALYGLPYSFGKFKSEGTNAMSAYKDMTSPELVREIALLSDEDKEKALKEQMVHCAVCNTPIPHPDPRGIEHVALTMPDPVPLEKLIGKHFCSAVCLEKFGQKKE